MRHNKDSRDNMESSLSKWLTEFVLLQDAGGKNKHNVQNPLKGFHEGTLSREIVWGSKKMGIQLRSCCIF